MIFNISYWAWFGLFYLIILTYKDLTNKRIVDTRYNYIMIGLSLSLTSHVHFKIWYLLILIGVIMVMTYFLSRYKAIGLADIHSLYWIFLGLGIIHMGYLATFSIIFLVLTVFYVLVQKKVLKYENPAPFYPVILCSFALTIFMFKMI